MLYDMRKRRRRRRRRRNDKVSVMYFNGEKKMK
jgi:hypothetical protein